ncbi:MAG: hypothetical protein ACREL5_00850 [Gemmatimonadales bacterium]
MTERLPARLDRAALERVLQRAAELQAGSREIGDTLSEDEVLALGTEVGISSQHLRQALIEERVRPVASSPTALDRWVGHGEVTADRVVQGSDDGIAANLTRWLDHHERFVVQRSAAGRLTFEPMDALAGTMRRVGAMFDPSRARPYLGKVELITAVITPLESGFCHVMLAGSMRRARAAIIGGAGGLAATGLVVGGVLMVISAPVLLAMVPVVGMGGVGYAVMRTFGGVERRARLGLERALDELERRPSLPSGHDAAPRATPIGQVVRGIAQEMKKAFDK